MSSDISEKLRLIRKSTGLSQQKFSAEIDVPLASYKRYETGANEVGVSVVQKILGYKDFNKYTLWLLNDSTNPSYGQISPDSNSPTPVPSVANVEKVFIETVVKCLMNFGYFGWVTFNTEKMDFDVCGKYIFKEVAPLFHMPMKDNAGSEKTINE
ncbi:helix-turn-helix domain-containing protein [Pseudoalteromonas sp. S16_S37]|uniref:helix-turn-helix domain-containing protein n=1 Tax=Pseudoalteromonas sp. S16_S37 TaxID=2720228 RepID=UPI0016808285|nr:helix-turn-helix transcriptional regulator [Pseudoalteromonas sp. S16_S37]MBD1582776.1 helix-turn-helix transcriptional regulator [Pseudoalteromonas sp. S16_S37]